MGLDHLDTTAFLIHQHSRLFALNELLVPLVLPLNLILIHLRFQVGLVVQKHVASEVSPHGFANLSLHLLEPLAHLHKLVEPPLVSLGRVSLERLL